MNIDSGWSLDFIWCTLYLGGLIDESVPYGSCALGVVIAEIGYVPRGHYRTEAWFLEGTGSGHRWYLWWLWISLRK